MYFRTSATNDSKCQFRVYKHQRSAEGFLSQGSVHRQLDASEIRAVRLYCAMHLLRIDRTVPSSAAMKWLYAEAHLRVVLPSPTLFLPPMSSLTSPQPPGPSIHTQSTRN